jgi:hypothetical protein
MLYHPMSEYYVQYLTNKLRKLGADATKHAVETKKGADAATEGAKATTANTKA